MKQYLTTGEAARICGVHINTIKSWVRKGSIDAAHTTVNGRWRISSASLERFLQASGMPVPGEFNRPHRILMIDDDPAVYELVRGAMKLSLLDCDISAAGDGYSGLIKIGEIKPDLLVLDIMMPGINGLEVLQRLRANPQLAAGMRVVVLTGAKDSKLVVRNIESASPDAVLFKPVSVVSLLETIQNLLHTGSAGQSDKRL